MFIYILDPSDSGAEHMAVCVPCALPSMARVMVRKDWWCPVLALYLSVAILNSLFLRNTQHRADSLGCVFEACLSLGRF